MAHVLVMRAFSILASQLIHRHAAPALFSVWLTSFLGLVPREGGSTIAFESE